MRKGIVFFLGMLTGVFLTFFGTVFLASMFETEAEEAEVTAETLKGLTIWEDKLEKMDFTAVEVTQVLGDGLALGIANEGEHSYELFTGPAVLLMSEQETYYDGQEVRAKGGKRFVRCGEYKYHTSSAKKTVPVVKLN